MAIETHLLIYIISVQRSSKLNLDTDVNLKVTLGMLKKSQI